MSMLKKIIFTVIFIIATLVVPAVLLLLFVDAGTTKGYDTFVIVFAVIIFGILGYIVASIRSMEVKFRDTMDEIKRQNAAIAYKITQTPTELDTAVAGADKTEVEPVKVDTTKVNLNPEEPLAPKVKTKTREKVVDDNFDDFK
ncbi:MAG: hypothetical protein E7533_00495 [Ruminococcaceae bacterium]|nr:hypothetical protein [Oscillospiraceae bacterium]